MSRNNQQRRAAKAKQRHHRAATPRRTEAPSTSAGSAPGGEWIAAQQQAEEADELLRVLARRAAVLSGSDLRAVVTYQLARRSTAVLAAMEKQAVGEVRARLAAAWEGGWEPRDLHHASARLRGRVGVLAGGAILDQARTSGAWTRAPQSWRDQLELLRTDGVAPAPAAELGWRPVSALAADGDGQVEGWTDLLTFIRLLAELPVLTPLGPPPSRWGRQPAAPVVDRTSSRDRVLHRIRSLLAKAEATDHPAEAESFTAKAQELMSRHAIDEALLRHDHHDDVPVETRRIHIQAPYAAVKALLLDAVARPNRSRAVFLAEHDICTLVGTPLDVDQVEMLFTSLLIQATRAMAESGHRRAGSFDRSATFRRSFLSAYAVRIGERLAEADRSTTTSYGAELVPVLQREADAVTAEFERQFPRTRAMSSGYLDPRGWQAGRDAADRAVLVAGRLTA